MAGEPAGVAAALPKEEEMETSTRTLPFECVVTKGRHWSYDEKQV